MIQNVKSEVFMLLKKRLSIIILRDSFWEFWEIFKFYKQIQPRCGNKKIQNVIIEALGP